MEEVVLSVLELKPGEKGKVHEILFGTGNGYRPRHGRGRRCTREGGGCGWGRRLLEALGLYRGQVLEVVENRGCGPVVLKVGGSRFVLGRGQAAHILVNPIREEVKS